MKNILLISAFALTALSFVAVEITPITLGTSIPNADRKMENVLFSDSVGQSKSVSLNDAKKVNGLLVIFSCNTCPYVAGQQTRINNIELQAQRMMIGSVIINSNEGFRDGDDSKSEMKKYGERNKFIVPYLVDSMSVMADAFGATRTPECFLFDKDGKLVYHGAIDDSPKDETAVKQHYLLDAMTAMSHNKPIAVGNTVSSGCTIKRKVAETK